MFLIPLLALGVAAFALYEMSDHQRHVADADVAHQTADAHLVQAAAVVADAPLVAPVGAPSDSIFDVLRRLGARAAAAISSIQNANVANQAAAAKTVDAAKTAKTPAEHAKVTESAHKVTARQDKIDSALVAFGVGLAGVKTFPGVTPDMIVAGMDKLAAAGMTVTGTDPWDIDSHQHGVKLRAHWDAPTQTLSLIIVDWDWVAKLAGADRVWSMIIPAVTAAMHGAT